MRFSPENCVTMITPYADNLGEMRDAKDSALNWYSRNLAYALKSMGVNLRILSSYRENPTADWLDNSVPIMPAFRRGFVFSPVQAAMRALRTGSKIIHIQHELFAFGGIGSALILPVVLALLKLTGRRIVTTVHGVMPLSSVDRAFIRRNGLNIPPTIVRVIFKSLIRALGAASDIIHVHEDHLKTLLATEYGLKNRIHVVPLGVGERKSSIAPSKAKAALAIPEDAPVLLFFGYLAAYKGVEYLMREIPEMLRQNKHLHVVIAGALPDRLAGTDSMPGYLVPERSDRVHITGFVADELVPTVFSAADVLVLPYTVAMSASGPLSLAMTYGCPVLFSRPFASMFPDSPGLFDIKEGCLSAAVARFFSEDQFRHSVATYTARLAEERNWPSVASGIAALYQECSVEARA